jgi:rhodanese-related sulfurtransferase
VNIEQYKAMPREGHILIDVREDNEWSAGHAAGAVHLSKGTIERDVETQIPDKSTTLVLYCGGGFRSALAGDALQQMGYKNVISLDGGWRGWNQAGLPVEKP